MDRKAYNRWYYLNYRKKGRTIGDGKQFDTKTLGPGQDKKRVKSVLNKAFNSHHTTITSEESHWSMGGKGGSKKRNTKSNDNKLTNRMKSIFSYKAPILISNKKAVEKGRKKVESFLRKLKKSTYGKPTWTEQEFEYQMGNEKGGFKRHKGGVFRWKLR